MHAHVPLLHRATGSDPRRRRERRARGAPSAAGEVVRAWVDEIPEDELHVHYAKAVDDLDDDDLSMLAAWHASLEVGTRSPTRSSCSRRSASSASTGARR